MSGARHEGPPPAQPDSHSFNELRNGKNAPNEAHAVVTLKFRTEQRKIIKKNESCRGNGFSLFSIDNCADQNFE